MPLDLSRRVGHHTKKGTLITQKMADAVANDVAGIVVVEDNTQAILSMFSSSVAAAVEAIGIDAEGTAKRLCPVDTGRLRNSITHTVDIDGLSAYAAIGTNVEYAPYVEYGTSRAKAQPFLTPAATEHGSRYRSIAKHYLENA